MSPYNCTTITSNDIGTTVFQICFVLLLRAGLVLIQLSSIPTNNVYTIIYHNIIDLAISITSFGTVGFVFAFGNDYAGVIGLNNWNFEDYNSNTIAQGFTACLTASGFITTVFAGRIQLIAAVVISICSTIIQSVIIHYVWHSNSWMHYQNLSGKIRSFDDHSGVLVIHVYAGTIALLGALFLGRRLILLTEISVLSIGVDSPASSITGYIFVIVGLIGFFPSCGMIIISTLMAVAGGVLATVFLQVGICKQPFTYWNMLKCMQGAVAGIVAIGAGVKYYTPLIAFAIAVGASSVCYLSATCIQNKTFIEDYCNIVAIHLVCGIISVTLPPLINADEKNRVLSVFWQLKCLLITFSLLLVIFSMLFGLLALIGFLRNKSEENNHARSVVVKKKLSPQNFLQRLFVVNVNTTCVEPGASRNNTSTQLNTHTDSEKNSTIAVPKQHGNQMNLQLEDKLNNSKKVRFAYTMSNSPNSYIQDYFQCSGDGSTLRAPSSYKLHRTEKCTNLLGNETMTKKSFCAQLENVIK